MTKTIADPFLAQNSGRRYPLADNTTGIDDRSILDMRLSTRIRTTAAYPSASVTGIDSDATGGTAVKTVTVRISCGSDTVSEIVFRIPTSISTSEPYTTTATDGVTIGEITVTSTILAEPKMSGSIPLARTTVICRSPSVDSIQGIGATDTPDTAVITGDIILDPGRNTDPYIDGQHIRLDIFKGAGTGEKCQDIVTGQNCENVLFTINGERPGSDGSIFIHGKDGVSVTADPDNNAIIISMDDVAAEKASVTCKENC